MLMVEYKSDRIEGMEGLVVTTLHSKDFIWTDEKSALLLKVVHEYKTTKIPTGLDWEAIRPKYSDITTRPVQKDPN